MRKGLKISVTYRLTVESDRWIAEQAELQGISKNALVQILINQAMKKEIAAQKKEKSKNE